MRERRAERSRRGRRERVTWKEKRAGRRLVWQDRGNRISWLRVHILTSRCLGAGRTLLSGCSGNSNYVHRYVYSLLVILQTWTAWENRVLTFHKYFSYTGAQGFELLCSWTYLIEFFFATVVNKDLHEISLSYCCFFFLFEIRLQINTNRCLRELKPRQFLIKAHMTSNGQIFHRLNRRQYVYIYIYYIYFLLPIYCFVSPCC